MAEGGYEIHEFRVSANLGQSKEVLEEERLRVAFQRECRILKISNDRGIGAVDHEVVEVFLYVSPAVMRCDLLHRERPHPALDDPADRRLLDAVCKFQCGRAGHKDAGRIFSSLVHVHQKLEHQSDVGNQLSFVDDDVGREAQEVFHVASRFETDLVPVGRQVAAVIRALFGEFLDDVLEQRRLSATAGTDDHDGLGRCAGDDGVLDVSLDETGHGDSCE